MRSSILFIVFINFSLCLSAQDYSNIKNSIEFSDELNKAKTYRNIDKALLSPSKVVSLKLNLGSDSIEYKKFINNLKEFKGLRKIIIDNFFGQKLVLPDSFWILHNLEFVSLHNLNIESFHGLEHLSGLKYLSLIGSRLDSIPNEIYKLEKLEFLDLTLNFIDSIPERILNLKNLRELDLTNNCFDDIPVSVTKLKQLEYLDFNNAETAGRFRDGTSFCFNKLNRFPNISQMNSIKQIHLYKTEVNSEVIKEIEELGNKTFVKYK